MLWLWWKLYHDWVVPRTTQKHWNLKETQSLGETRCKKFWDHFDEYYSHSPRNVKQASGKWRSIAWTIQVKNSLTAKSLRYEIWGPVPWREWKIAAMRPRQSIVYCQNMYKLKKRHSYILFALGKVSNAGCIHNTTAGKRVCGRFENKYAYGQQVRPWLCWVGHHEDIEESLTANGEVQTREEATVHVKGLDLFVTFMLLEGTPAGLRLGSSARIMGILTTGPASHQKWQEVRLQCSELRTISCPWFVNEFLHVIVFYFSNIFIAGFCDWHGKSNNTKEWEYECRVTGKPVARISKNTQK